MRWWPPAVCLPIVVSNNPSINEISLFSPAGRKAVFARCLCPYWKRPPDICVGDRTSPLIHYCISSICWMCKLEIVLWYKRWQASILMIENMCLQVVGVPRDRRQPADGGSLSPLTGSRVESDLHDLLPARGEPITPSAAVPFTPTNRSEGPL